MKCFCAGTRQVARLLTRYYEEELAAAGITPAQFELLATISGRPGLSQGELAEALSLDQTTLSRNLKPLLQQKWVNAGGSSEDRRRVVYTASRKGSAALRRAMPHWQRAQSRIETALGKETRAIWESLDRLRAEARAVTSPTMER